MTTTTEVVKRSYEFSNDEQKVLIMALSCQMTDLTQRIRRARELGRSELCNQLTVRYRASEALLDDLYKDTDFKPTGF